MDRRNLVRAFPYVRVKRRIVRRKRTYNRCDDDKETMPIPDDIYTTDMELL